MLQIPQKWWQPLVALLLLLSSGCGSESAGQAAGSERSPATQSSVVFYTHRYLPEDQQLIQQFSSRTGIAVDVRRLSEDEIQARAAAGQLSDGDVVLMPSLADIQALQQAGVLQPFYVDNFSSGEVPDRYLDREGYWAALNHWTMAVVYRASTVEYDQVKHYRFLAMPQFKDRVLVAEPDSSGLVGLVASFAASKGEEAARVWTRLLVQNLARTPSGNDYDVLWALGRGEADLALVNASAFFRWQRSGNPEAYEMSTNLRMRYPVDIGNSNFYNATTIGMLANAPNRQSAMDFINFLFNKESQELLSEGTKEYPGHVYAMPSDFLMDFADLPVGELRLEQTEQHIPLARQILAQYFPDIKKEQLK